MKFPRISKRVLMIAAAIAFVAFAILQALDFHSRAGADKAAGIYWSAGAQSYLVIEAAPLRRLRVKSTSLFRGSAGDLNKYIVKEEVGAEMRGGRLIIRASQRLALPKQAEPVLGVAYKLEYILKPSEQLSGDWDLIDCRMQGDYLTLKWDQILSKKFWREAYAVWTAPGFRHSDFAMAPKMPPFPLFLRRADDSRVAEYFKSRIRDGEPRPDALLLLNAIAADHPASSPAVRPGELALRLHQIEMEAAAGDLSVAEKIWHENEADFADEDDVLFKIAAYYVWQGLQCARMRRDHPEILPVEEIFPPLDLTSGAIKAGFRPATRPSLEQTVYWLESLAGLDGLLFVRPPQLPRPVHDRYFSRRDDSNHYEIIPVIKAALTEAEFRLLRGDRAGARKLCAGLVALGEAMNAGFGGSTVATGIGLRWLGRTALALQLRNACETPQELRAMQDTLESLYALPGQRFAAPKGAALSPIETLIHAIDATDGAWAPLALAMRFSGETARSQFLETDARLQDLRLEAALRLWRAERGKFPDISAEVENTFGGRPPFDPFNDCGPLKVEVLGDGLRIYGNGPDADNDKAAITYDPTNGAVSDGDAINDVLQERDYPFPVETVRANNARELIAAFPKGLPPDPFASPWGLPLSILDASETEPLRIFSYGPADGDNQPGASPVVSTPVPGESSATSEKVNLPEGQRVYWRNGAATVQNSPATYYRAPQDQYDPTNGIFSAGDLFWTVPPRE